MFWQLSSPEKRQRKHFSDPMLRTRSDGIFIFVSFLSFIFFSYGCRLFSNCLVKVVHCGGEGEAKLYSNYPSSQLMSNKIFVKIL
jgi:hypothetical protein